LKNRTLSPVVKRFIECARDIAGSMGAKAIEEVGAMSLHSWPTALFAATQHFSRF
jgi:hypothetical protein